MFFCVLSSPGRNFLKEYPYLSITMLKATLKSQLDAWVDNHVTVGDTVSIAITTSNSNTVQSIKADQVLIN
jgi:hypothetical protein